MNETNSFIYFRPLIGGYITITPFITRWAQGSPPSAWDQKMIFFDLKNPGVFHGFLSDPQEVKAGRFTLKAASNQLFVKAIPGGQACFA